MTLTRRSLLSIAGAVGLAPQAALQSVAAASGFVGAAASAIPKETLNTTGPFPVTAYPEGGAVSHKYTAISNKFREAETLIGVRLEFLEGCLRSGRFPASYSCHRSWSLGYKQSLLLQEIEKLRQDMTLLNHLRYGTSWEKMTDTIADTLGI